jgi:hypothetical protein
VADLRTQIETARGSGYSDDEIASFLSQRDPRVQRAIQSGYSASEVLQFLTTQPATPAAAPATRVQPEVQAQRDEGRLDILQGEREQIQQRVQAGDQSAASDLQAIDREIARTRPAAARAAPPAVAPAPVPAVVQAPVQTPQVAPAAMQEQPAGLGAQLTRQAGLTARMGMEGLGGLLGIATDPLAAVINQFVPPERRLQTLRSVMSTLATEAGLPQPETAVERVVQQAGQAMVGVAPTVALGRAVPTLAGLAAAPGAQVTGAAGAGGAAQTAAEAGMGLPAQIAAGLAGGAAGLRRTPTPAVQAPSRRAMPVERVEPTFDDIEPIPSAPTPSASAVPGGMAPQQLAGEVPPAAAAQPAGFTPPAPFEATITPESVSDVLTLARKAAGSGKGAASARAKLADMAQINPEARDAARRLEIDVPFDVLADNPQVRSAVGLTRSLVGGAAESDWLRTVREATRRSDEVMQQYDAIFVAGRPSTDAASQRVLDSLKKTRDKLDADAGAIYRAIDGTPEAAGLVPKTTAVEMNNLRNTIAGIVGEVGEGGMTAQERRLSQMIEAGPVTYGRLIREKNLIGKAMQGQQSPYGDLDSATLKRLYGALAQDQLDNVGRIAGEDVRQQLRAANLMTAQRKGLEKRMVAGFGTELTGSIATKMQTALRSGAKGDATAFNELLKTVPKDLQRETLATALASVTASRRGTSAGGVSAEESVFGFNDFTKTYRDLRANPTVYSKMAQVMGPEWDRAMRDLYEVSKRIADAQGKVLTTGKANQILGEASVQGLIGKVMNSSVAQRVAVEVVSKAPGGGLIAPDLINFMQSGNKQAVQKASELFASPDFQKLAVEAATKGGQVDQNTLRRTATSGAFSRFASAANLPRNLDARIMWLQSALQVGREISQEPQQ